jgi:hypothetical protein
MDASEREQYRAAIHGDREAFEMIIRAHSRSLFAITYGMKNYPALMQSLDSLGKVENVTVQRQDRTGTQIDEANAPADISIQVYSRGNIVSHQSGPLATLREVPWRKAPAQSCGVCA